MNTELTVSWDGFLEVFDITDKDNVQKISDAKNSVHFENASLALAQSLARKNTSGVYVGPILKMVFGNGGTSVNGVGNITYLSKNTVGQNATIYNQTYSKIVDPNNPQNLDPSRNYLDASHVSGNLYSDVIIVCTLEYGEPSDQQVLDTTSTLNNMYVFDEIGVVNYDGKLLSHVIFSPIQKSANRIFEIRYSLRISMV